LDQIIHKFETKSIKVLEYILKRDDSKSAYCYILLSKRVDLRRPKFLLFNGVQPEISSSKSNEELISIPAVDLLSNVDLKIVEKARADHKSSPFKQLLEGAPLTKFVEDYPQTLLKLPQMEKSLALYKLKK